MDKKIKVVMFDLDGTLLPMDQDVFVGTYFNLLAKKMTEYGYFHNFFIFKRLTFTCANVNIVAEFNFRG